MSDLTTFESFKKIPRAAAGCVITEKLDGTNAQICVDPEGVIRVGSRNRWIFPNTPENKTTDNYGFAAWVAGLDPNYVRESLGIGRHFGEWWGPGIARGYGLAPSAGKRFSLFNTYTYGPGKKPLPSFASCVPILYEGPYTEAAVQDCLERLKRDGSVAAPGFMDPEGIVIFHPDTGTYRKVTYNGNVSKFLSEAK